jgi:serine phosphatase RsbU (regulator of sigma subunit)
VTLLKVGAETASELLNHISEALQVYTADTEQFDDITMLAVRHTRKPV